MKMIHGSYAEDRAIAAAPAPTEYKSCPICGAVCFVDMEVCFGCLHQFDTDDVAHPTQHSDRSASNMTPHPTDAPEANPSSTNSIPHTEPQESYSEEELAALLEQMRDNFALPVQEAMPMQKSKSAEAYQASKTPPQTAGSGQDGNGMTARHVCEGRDGQQFEIIISIKML